MKILRIALHGSASAQGFIDPEVGGAKDVGFFKYPSGNGPVRTITGFQNPAAVAISK